MKHVVSYSGGICSALAAVRVKEGMRTGDEIVLLFADTLIEDEDLYRFNKEFSAWLGLPLTVVCDGRTPWQVFSDVRMLGNSRIDPCSRILKRELLWHWTVENCDPDATTVYLGTDWTEDHRLKRVRAARPGWRIEAPMADPPLFDKSQMSAYMRDTIGIEPPRLYGMGFAHNNCGGFCIKSGQAQFELLLRQFPQRYHEHEKNEQKIREQLDKNVSVLRDRRGGETTPLTLREFRERLERQPDLFDSYDWGGCGCAID